MNTAEAKLRKALIVIHPTFSNVIAVDSDLSAGVSIITNNRVQEYFSKQIDTCIVFIFFSYDVIQ